MLLRILAARLKKSDDNTTNEPYYTLIMPIIRKSIKFDAGESHQVISDSDLINDRPVWFAGRVKYRNRLE
jgi:hypothetical protein